MKSRWLLIRRPLLALAGAILLAFSAGAQTLPPGSETIYDDALENAWQNYSWATLNYSCTTVVHGTGGTSISVDAGAYEALYLHHAAFDSTLYQSVTFWINGGAAGGQSLQLQGRVNGVTVNTVSLPDLTANTWQQMTVSLASLGVVNQSQFDGLILQNRTNVTLPTVYVVEISLLAVPPPATIQLQANAGSVIRRVDGRIFGLNTAIWDGQLSSAFTRSLLAQTHMGALRYPGGSSSDDYDWQLDRSVANNTFNWVSSFSTFAAVALAQAAPPYLTLNYGSGTPEQAAAWVAYANGVPGNTLALGTDARNRHWQTVDYWASMRAAKPLATDDGYNFLRVGRTAPYGFKYWEVGNECYGGWEQDLHGSTLSGTAHDPYTYAQNFALFRQMMQAVDPTVHVGAVVVNGADAYGNGQHAVTNPRDSTTHTGWTPVVLANLKTLGVLPDFLVVHDYPQNPGEESDASLLTVAAVMAANDAADLRQMLTDYIDGTPAAGIELALTEVNDVSSAPGKQSVSLVDGLFFAEMLGSLATTEINACTWWALRNGANASGNNADTLYGWRPFGDYGLVASGDRSDTPVNTPYPSFHAAELLAHWAAGGDSVVAASSNYPLLTVHAATRANGDLCLLVINKDPADDLTAQIALTGFAPGSGTAVVYQYGKSNDLDNTDLSTSTLTNAGSSFSATFPSYSMTVIDLARPSTPYELWQKNHFTATELATPAISGDLADPDGDGIVNLAEYALNLDPRASDVSGLPTVSTVTLNGVTNPTLTYTKVKAATDLTYTVEVSGDLVNWNGGSGYTADVSTVDQGTTQQVTTRDLTAITPTTHRFMRLRVTGP